MNCPNCSSNNTRPFTNIGDHANTVENICVDCGHAFNTTRAPIQAKPSPAACPDCIGGIRPGRIICPSCDGNGTVPLRLIR